MSISGISASSAAAGTTSNPSVDSTIAQTLKQITKVQQQIRDETNSDDDAKTKLQLVQSYTAELVALQMKITQLQQQKAQATADAVAKNSAPADAGGTGGAQAAAPLPSDTSRYLNVLA